jgi:hypothetical protein
MAGMVPELAIPMEQDAWTTTEAPQPANNTWMATAIGIEIVF